MPQQRESNELAAFLRRMNRALVRRCEAGDITALVAMIDVHRDMSAQIKEAGAALGEHHSWATIAGELGITRQAAEKRFG